MKADVVVIGSGISGLTAAAILAGKGKKVVLVEKQPRIGGALKQFKRGDSPFDVGFHYTGCLGRGDILHLLWGYCRILERLTILPFPAEGHDRLLIDGHPEPVRGYFSASRFAAELKRHFPQEASAIDRYFLTIGRICKRIPFYAPHLPLTDFLQGYRPETLSLAAFLEDCTTNRALQAALAASSILYGVPTDQVAVDVHAMVVHGYYNGAYGVAGGGQAVVDAFGRRLREAGAEILTNSAAASIRLDTYGAAGIITRAGTSIDSRHIIYTGHPAALLDLVPESCFRPAYRRRLRNLQNSLSLFALFGTIAATPKAGSALDWNNHLALPAGPNPLPASPGLPADRRSLLLTCTERDPDNTLRRGYKNVILLQPALWEEVRPFQDCPKGGRTPAYTHFKRRITEDMLQTAAQKWGDFLGPIQPLAVGTPLTLRDELSAPEGCAYGAMHCLNQLNPQPRTRVPGLYLSGQSTLMTGIVGASISGMVGAGEILGREQLWQEIRRWG